MHILPFSASTTPADYREFVGQYTLPTISHEIGQWCVYPSLTERRKYTGYLKAKNFDVFEDRLRDSGLRDYAPEFLYASGRLQVLCYKEDIESALRTHGMGGFQLLGLQDFPGQALVGVVDPFWDDKGYVTGEEYRRFCAPTVPLARMRSRVVRSGEAFPFLIVLICKGTAFDQRSAYQPSSYGGLRFRDPKSEQDLACLRSLDCRCRRALCRCGVSILRASCRATVPVRAQQGA